MLSGNAAGVRGGGPDGITTLLGGYDAYYDDDDPSDNDGHGTFVAGTIAQSTNNGRGVAGMAPGASILPVKVLSDQGFGDVRALANGIVYATDQGADVINMSLGSPSSSQTEYRAIQYAYDRDVVLVAASGNEFARSISYPAAYPEVIAVGAVRASGTRSPYSNTGSGLEIVAPGGDLNRDDNGDGYADGVLRAKAACKATSFIVTSDSSLKSQQRPIPTSDCYMLLDNIVPKQYERTDMDMQSQSGFIAQDVQAAAKLTGNTAWEPLTSLGEDFSLLELDSLPLTAFLWTLVRDLSARVHLLESGTS